MKPDVAAAFDAALSSLKADPWFADPEASHKAWRYNLMWEAGLGDDAISFTGEYPERIIELALNGDRIAQEALIGVAVSLTDAGAHRDRARTKCAPSKVRRRQRQLPEPNKCRGNVS
jgi:hypothetical protein